METILQHAQGLVYSLLSLMSSVYQKASFNALLGLFLENQGHALPEHTQVKSASSFESSTASLVRFGWSSYVRAFTVIHYSTNRSLSHTFVGHDRNIAWLFNRALPVLTDSLKLPE